MGTDLNGLPQGNDDPKLIKVPPYGSVDTTQPSNPYQSADPYTQTIPSIPPPPPQQPNKKLWIAVSAVVVVLVLVIGVLVGILLTRSTSGPSSTPTTTVGISTASVLPTQPPQPPTVTSQNPNSGYTITPLGIWNWNDPKRPAYPLPAGLHEAYFAHGDMVAGQAPSCHYKVFYQGQTVSFSYDGTIVIDKITGATDADRDKGITADMQAFLGNNPTSCPQAP